KRGRTIPQETHEENRHRARRRVPSLRSAGIQPRRGAEILRAHVQPELFRVFLVSEVRRPWPFSIFAFYSPVLILTSQQGGCQEVGCPQGSVPETIQLPVGRLSAKSVASEIARWREANLKSTPP